MVNLNDIKFKKRRRRRKKNCRPFILYALLIVWANWRIRAGRQKGNAPFSPKRGRAVPRLEPEGSRMALYRQRKMSQVISMFQSKNYAD